MHNPARAHQSRGRPLTPAEQALAEALGTIYADGTHDFAAVAAALNERKVARPSGGAGGWTAAVLDQELRDLNASLDEAYARHGIGA